MFYLRLKYFFINLFRLPHEIYDDSLEPFEAQRVALEMYEKEDQVFKNRASLKIIEEMKNEQKNELKAEENQKNNSQRYSMQYLYNNKYKK